VTPTITGIVANGVIVPSSPLPEGTHVEIQVRLEFTPEEREEFEAWERASAGSIEMVERLADEMDAHEKR
jgi:hypothetical protein